MELADALDHNRQCLLNDRRLTHPLADKARALAVLAQPEPEVAGPTDEELYALWDAECSGGDFQGCFRFARAAIAADRARHFGHQPAPSAEGEVAELVEFLRDWGDDYADEGTKWHRAADLLEQRHPSPVPVSERLPGPEDCDAEGRCWWLLTGDVARIWALGWRSSIATHWLPATALPLPAGEVQP